MSLVPPRHQVIEYLWEFIPKEPIEEAKKLAVDQLNREIMELEEQSVFTQEQDFERSRKQMNLHILAGEIERL